MKRKRYSDEQIAFALRQTETGVSVEEICRKLGVSEATFYRWKKQFAGMGVVEIRRLKQEHLGIDEATDVLSFPIDGTSELPSDLPRQLGDVVICPQVVADEWRRPLVHGLLHLLGYDHGTAMSELEEAYL